MKYKMVIVQITSAEDKDIPTGKLIAQGAHAAVAAADIAKVFKPAEYEGWLTSSQTKIVCKAKDQKELEELYLRAKNERLPVSKIVDAGRTVFSGPTFTAIAIGPDLEEKINKVTAQLSLL